MPHNRLSRKAIRRSATMPRHAQPVDKAFPRQLSCRMFESRHTAASEAVSIPDIIPIFPLPDVVFFPDTYLPLHIFEPRYQDMIAEAGTDACIGMALLKEGWERDDDGHPAICALGCVGRIQMVKPLGDGRSNLILHGLARYVIEEELFGASYRRAKITVSSRHPFHTLDEDSVRTTVTELAVRYLHARKARELCTLVTNESNSDAILVNSLSSCLDFTSLEKQFLLESASLHQQARRLIDLLRFKISDVMSSSGGG